MLTDDHSLEFRDKGYTILKDALNEKELNLLHEEADELANYLMSEGYDLVKDLGCIIEPWTCGYLDKPKTDSYKTNKLEYSQQRDSISSTLDTSVSEIILTKYATWASRLLQSKAIFLLNEQYIVKPPRTFSEFAWHRDSDYYHDPKIKRQSSIACWTALDKVSELNGTLKLQDGSVIDMPAGSVLFMSSQLVHKSTENSTDLFRRAFMPQFSTTPFVDSNKPHLPLWDQCLGLAVNCFE